MNSSFLKASSFFLDSIPSYRVVELLPWISSDPVPKRPKPKTKEKDGRGPTLMDQFVVNDKDVIMDDDGTMVAAETQDDF